MKRIILLSMILFCFFYSFLSAQEIKKIMISPPTDMIVVNGTKEFKVECKDENGNMVNTPDSLIWSVDPENSGRIENGIFTALSPGTTTVTVGYRDITAQATIEVKGAAPVISSLLISPIRKNIPLGGNVTFKVDAKDVNGEPIRDIDIKWSLSNPALGEIDEHGLFRTSNVEGTGEIIVSAGGKEVKATITTLNGNVDYASKWIDLRGKKSDEIEILIEDQVEKLIKERDNNTKKYYNSGQIEILKNKWRQRKEELETQWLNDFFRYERDVSECYQELVILNQDSLRVAGEISFQNQKRATAQRRRTFFETQSNSRNEWKKNEERDFISRLKNIPISVFLIGMAKSSSFVGDEIIGDMLENMILKNSLEIVKGREIKQIYVTYDNKNYGIIEDTIYGNAQIVDAVNMIRAGDDGQEYLLKFVTLDVFPYINVEAKFSEQNKVTEEEPEGFEIMDIDFNRKERNESILIVKNAEYEKKYTYTDLKFSEDYIYLIESNYQYAQEKWNTSLKEINIIFQNFTASMDSAKKDISEAEKNKKLQDDIIDECDKEVNRLNKEKEETSKKKAAALEYYKKASERYQKHYLENKKSFANKEIQDIRAPGAKAIDVWKTMAKETFSIQKDLKEKQVSTSVYTKSGGVNDADIFELEKFTENYVPTLDSLQFLYIGRENFEGFMRYIINIAYAVTWTTEKTPFVIARNFNINGTPRTVLIDKNWRYAWYYDSTVTDVNRAILRRSSPKPDVFILPNYDDILKLAHSRSSHLEYNDDIFKELKWPLDSPQDNPKDINSYLTNDKLVINNTEYYLGFKLNSLEKVPRGDTSTVNVLWLKKDIDDKDIPNE